MYKDAWMGIIHEPRATHTQKYEREGAWVSDCSKNISCHDTLLFHYQRCHSIVTPHKYTLHCEVKATGTLLMVTGVGADRSPVGIRKTPRPYQCTIPMPFLPIYPS